MIIVNKGLDEARLIVTVTEKATGAGNGYRLAIYSPFTKKDYSILIPENTSLFQSRYDEFIIPIIQFQDMEPGVYNYTIYEYSWFETIENGFDVTDLEKGVLKIVDNDKTEEQKITDQYDFIEPADTDDDFIVYEP